MPAVVVERRPMTVADHPDAAADVEDVAQATVDQFDSDQVRRPYTDALLRVLDVLTVVMSAVQDQPRRLSRPQLTQPSPRQRLSCARTGDPHKTCCCFY